MEKNFAKASSGPLYCMNHGNYLRQDSKGCCITWEIFNQFSATDTSWQKFSPGEN